MIDSELKSQQEVYEVTLTLQNEEGKEEFYNILDFIEHDGLQYLILLAEEDVDDKLVTIYQFSEDEEGDFYIPVENEEILKSVFKIFEARRDFLDLED